MVDVALGTQTAGSVIRPASYCGVLGFKPTFGTVATAGLKPVAPSLDTVGWFARDVASLDRLRVALTRRPPATLARGEGVPPTLALVRTGRWDDASDDVRAAVEEAARLASAAGATVVERPLTEQYEQLALDQPVVMAYELARSFAWEWHHHRDQVSRSLQDLIERGLATDAETYDDVRARTALARAAADDDLFGDADALLTPAASGEAPAGLASTGDPYFARLWTLLGLPAVAVPGLTGATGLPIGVQLVGRAGRDAELLALAEWLAGVLPPAPAPTL
jgi:Asp-tRNA(Asn)/Glu-tRNA(Gln) amidotransferase A subunit family amidase